MKKDWRATTYDPQHITPTMLADARAYCDYDASLPAPLSDADVEVRRKTADRSVVPWANDAKTAKDTCAFSFQRPSPCYLLLRKIPKTTVATYANTLFPATHG